MEEPASSTSETKYQIWLSTDGKHTVQVEVQNETFLMAALENAKAVYDDIVSTYGLKGQQPAFTITTEKPQSPSEPAWMNTPAPPPTRQPISAQPSYAPVCGNSACTNFNQTMKLVPAGISKTSGRPYPAFYSCNGRTADGEQCKYRPPKS